MAELGILHDDVRYANILHCADVPPGVEGLLSPFKQRRYEWRIVDFDKSLKVDSVHKSIMFNNDSHLDRLLDSLPWGCVIEPWQ